MKGFNEYFISSNSLASAARDVYGAYEWASQTFGNIVGSRAIQDASITNAKIGTAAIGTANIGTLTFNQISGGTATLGGAANGDGVVSVLGSAGSESVRLDNTGVTINDGKMTFKNSGGTTVMDGTGLVSSANFASDVYFNGSTIATSSTSFVDISGGSLTFVLTRSTKVLISFSGEIAFGGGSEAVDYGASLRLAINGATQEPTVRGSFIFSGPLSFVMHQTLAHTGIYTLAAGTHTAKLQWASTSGDNVNMTGKNLNYIVLGT